MASSVFSCANVSLGEALTTTIKFQSSEFRRLLLSALCYFVSNNCMFYIIRYLGASTFQIMNNLKVLSTGVFMYTFLGRKLSWLQWKALIMLVIGCMVTQLSTSCGKESHAKNQSHLAGYGLVFVSAVASGAGGVFSERLLKVKVPRRRDRLKTRIRYWRYAIVRFPCVVWCRDATYGHKLGFSTGSKPIPRVQRVCVRDGGHALHMWSFSFLHTQILG